MAKTFFGARVVMNEGYTGAPTYLWKFRTDNRPGLRGRKRVDTTSNPHQVMLRATAKSIVENLRDAEQFTSLRFEVAQFEVLDAFSVYAPNIKDFAVRRASAKDGAFVQTIGDYVYVLRAKDRQPPAPESAEAVVSTTMPQARDGLVQQYGDAVILSAADWDLISQVVRGALDAGGPGVPSLVAERVAALQFAECVDAEVE